MKNISKTLAALVAATSLLSFNLYAVEGASDTGTNPDTGMNASADAGTAGESSLKPTGEKATMMDGKSCEEMKCCTATKCCMDGKKSE